MPPALPPETHIGAVALTVADLAATQDFYERAVGLRPLESSSGAVTLGAGENAVLELHGDPDAPPRPRGTTGLFHMAILVPGRAELGAVLRRVTGAGFRFSGASDHLVSEALYLHDPEGNGIEIYRDRPREEWPQAGGELQMDTLPLDLESLLAEGDGSQPPSAEAANGTRMGHVHLNVSDLAEAERFYAGLLGFDVMIRSYPGALFVAAAGYHHHIGLNTWAGEGAPPPPPGSRGLRHYEIVLPDSDSVRAAAERVASGGFEVADADGGARTADPSGNGIVLTTPSGG